jgi:hypothetical protein
MTRKCPRCHKTKPLDEENWYLTNTWNENKFRSPCRACIKKQSNKFQNAYYYEMKGDPDFERPRAEARARWASRNRDKINKHAMDYYWKYRERLNKQKAERRRARKNQQQQMALTRKPT